MRRAFMLVVVSFLVAGSVAHGDEIKLKNGDRLTGKIVKMVDGKVTLTTSWGGDVTFPFEDLAEITIDGALPLKLDDGSELMGTVKGGQDGFIDVTTGNLEGRIRLSDVVSINKPLPEAKPPVVFAGFIRGGATITDGNTRTREANAGGQLTARSENMRLLLRGRWNYGENRRNSETLFKRNTTGEIKMDFFATKKVYVYANALFQGDTFQDLNLRTALGGGVGYQFVEEDHLHLMVEGGLSYVSEDRRRDDDDETLAARFAWRFTWDPIVDRVKLFWNGEVFPSVEDEKDFFLNTSAGVRLAITTGFFASAQVNFRYDSTPASGFDRRDTAYIFSLGYEF